MRVSLQPMDNVLAARVHPSGDYGDDYTWGCIIEPRGEVALIHLAQRAAWERRKCGESRWTREFSLGVNE